MYKETSPIRLEELHNRIITHQFFSGTVYFLASLDRAVTFVVVQDLLLYSFRVISPGSHLNHALQDAQSQIIVFSIRISRKTHHYNVEIRLNCCTVIH